MLNFSAKILSRIAGGLSMKLSLFSNIPQNSELEKQNSQNLILQKWALYRIKYQKNRLFTKFITRKMDTSQNSMYRHESFLHFLGFAFLKKRVFQIVFEIDKIMGFEVVMLNNFCNIPTNYLLPMRSDSFLRIQHSLI